jgi:IMP dehydrogenase
VQKQIVLPEGLTYDDVLLIPQRSFIDHRSDVSTETFLTKKIKLHTPFVSANMDTVTEHQMAIAMAKEGAIGIIHRFMGIENQADEVARVKRYVGYLLKNPYTLPPTATLNKVWKLNHEKGIDSFIIVDEQNKVLGIITSRDTLFKTNGDQNVVSLMTPFSKLITGTPKTTFNEAKHIFQKHRIEKLPIIDKDKKLYGLITAKSVKNYEKFPFSTKDEGGRYRVGAAVGVVKDYLERTEKLIEAGCDAIVVDVAHGHNDVAMRAIKEIRKKFDGIQLIGGNVATPEGAKDLIKLGCDAIKVGIGPGGLCITRTVAGVGVPQLTAVMECAKICHKFKVPLIADGGTNYPGDIAKAIGAGASTCMLAGWFAGTDESPGGIIVRKGLKFKVHRGSASFLATADRKIKLENSSDKNLNTIVPEGVEAMIPYKGKVDEVIYQLAGALKSGMSYCNAKTIKDLWKNARFIKITSAGLRESKSHNVEEI